MTTAQETVGVQVRDGSHLRRHALEDLTSLAPAPWLIVAPHDDDLVLGMGMTTHAAIALGVEVHVAVVTDGSRGYHRIEDRDKVAHQRKAELLRAAQQLGMDAERIHGLGYPDGSLSLYEGCREPGRFPGVAQSLTGMIRACGAGSVFCCTPRDIHPDHRISASETAIACFWASSKIWNDLGDVLARTPSHWEYAVYCPFESPPELQVRAANASLHAKLDALACFESQPVIDEMVARLREDGPVEYFRRSPERTYRPAIYGPLFEPRD